MKYQSTNERNFTPLVLIATIGMLSVSGCVGDMITPANQDVVVRVRRHAHGDADGIKGAVVTAVFPDEDGLTNYYREQLEYCRKTNISSAVTDSEGYARIPIYISGPWYGLGDDQITGGPVCFRLEVEKRVEYFWDKELHIGNKSTKSDLDLQIESIGKPYKRKSPGS